jgi:zinc/manganese transport system ATP-binding protein
MLTRVAPFVRLENLTLSYRRHPAVHHVTGTFPPGSFTAIFGPNGAGKSTLLKGIVGLIKPDSGRVVLEGVARHDIGYLPQQSALDRSFPMRVLDVAAMGLWRKAGIFSSIGRKSLGAIEEAIATVGLTGFEDRNIDTLSGGQFQRALFARLLLQDARLILLDEPFTAIDARTCDDLMALIARWHSERRTVVTVLHDLDMVRAHIPQTLLLAREKVAWGETQAVLTDENLARARRLHEAFEDDAEPCEMPA